MVQVDIFWSYGIGAGFALAASSHIRLQAQKKEKQKPTPLLDDPFFTRTLLFLATLFAPSGICLLWAFPSWETMHVGDKNLPAWLVTLFAVTNITQGILGFWFTRLLVRRGRYYLAFLQPLLAYFAMFFILVHGWDGTGYKRFFSATKADFLAFQSSNIAQFFSSDVALTLYGMGVILVPVMLYWFGKWVTSGQKMLLAEANNTRQKANGPGIAAVLFLVLIFVGGLGSAIVASLIIHSLGWIFGSLVAVVVLGLVVISRWGLGPLLSRRLILE